ncbi:NDP-hexose 2,3-dehydratase family protein [Winogradskya humida]|uniref:NDP-hexose 2,3-dehydratase n=1 Tax=Winogradskya humida TaxID=113566 RepID=A0ABQ3ZH16_9ACTN|nr:NDP-hexose 2,3-dehydratase family protein [Actinoplanes humidus]GIE17848.1 NDP-hexose 2,3-dehydratase [Actinoplanes humidus]
MARPTVLTRPALADRFAASARAPGALLSDDEFDGWFAGRRHASRFAVERIPLAGLRGWHEDPGTGNLVHETGRFFTVEGLSVRTGTPHSWMQPIIQQSEIGILGLAVKEFDGVLHLLMQAKMEPGNVGLVQLSPTVQATRSNYVGVHRGRPITHLDYFTQPGRSRVLVDVLQSEQGSWFLHKRNRNMIVEVTEDVPEHPDFCWLTLAQVRRLLRADNVINMDARSVLSCVPEPAGDEGTARHSGGELLRWLTDVKARADLQQRLVPLRGITGWHRSGDAIRHDEGRFFEVVAIEAAAGNREVGHWTQPLIAPVGQGIAAFLTRPIGGVPHLLVQAKMEAGVRDVAELAPTFQALPANFAGAPDRLRPRFLDEVLAASGTALRYDSVQSEEGGRFHHATNRYQVIEVGTGFPLDEPPGFRWVTPGQLRALLQHPYYVNVQARSLLAGLGAVR